MAKLEIRLNEEGRKKKAEQEGQEFSNAGLQMRDYDFLIDGHEPSHLMDVSIHFGPTNINTATISFGIDDMVIDADFLTSLEAHVKDKKK